VTDPAATEEIVIELSDTDMARFVHLARVVEYFEVGLRGVMEAIDLTFQDLFDHGLGLPIVDVSCRYVAPMTYGDRVTVATTVEGLSEQTMTLRLRFETAAGDLAAEGTMICCFYDIEARRGTAIPEDVRRSLAALAE